MATASPECGLPRTAHFSRHEIPVPVRKVINKGAGRLGGSINNRLGYGGESWFLKQSVSFGDGHLNGATSAVLEGGFALGTQCSLR